MGQNGSYKNGSGKGPDDPEKILAFPTLAERDRLRAQKEAQEKALRAQYAARKNPPFFNFDKIPLLIKIVLPVLVAIHAFIHLGLDNAGILMTYARFGFVPYYYSSAPELFMIFGPFTHILIHGSWMHLAMNTLMLAALGTFFTREYGSKKMIVYFVACALGGALLYGIVSPFSRLPLIGASGGISGLFAALLVMMYKKGAFHRAKIVRQYGITAVFGIWIGITIGIAFLLGGGQSWEAHTGGLIVGLLMMTHMQRRDLRFWRL